MTYMFAILLVGPLAATGIYNPQVIIITAVLSSQALLTRFTVRHPRHLLISRTAKRSADICEKLLHLRRQTTRADVIHWNTPLIGWPAFKLPRGRLIG